MATVTFVEPSKMVALSRHLSKRACSCSSYLTPPNDLKTEEKNEKGTLDYRIFFGSSSKERVSPWHSIPLYADDGCVNMVCEIPRNTRAKYEVATKEENNPIKQDVKKGKVRDYAMPILWNYGMLPQTWEDPTHLNEDCHGAWGDNDPLDVVEIGAGERKPGDVYAVKPLAAYAMIDEGELDWKVVCVAADDPRAALCKDVDDLELHFPGELAKILDWFKFYKVPDGKEPNRFELDEKPMDVAYTMEIIAQTHAFWAGLLYLHRASKLQKGDAKLDLRVDGAPSLCPVHHAKALEEHGGALDDEPEPPELINGSVQPVVVLEGELPEFVREHLEATLPLSKRQAALRVGLERSLSLKDASPRSRDIIEHSKSPMGRNWSRVDSKIARDKIDEDEEE